MKKMILALLALCMTLSLCACGQTEEPATEAPVATTAATVATEAPTEAPTEASTAVTYTVKVVDEEGNPVAGAKMQMCLDSCLPSKTNEEGIATFTAEEADYHVSFMVMPEGYELTTTETEFFFADGSYEMTITLKSVA